MKMTKRFEKKLQALADKMGLDTNFDWDVGWFDFSHDCVNLGAVRFYGYAMNTKRKLEIYVATAFTKICYYENGRKFTGYGWAAAQNPLLIWDPTVGNVKPAEDGTTHETLIFNNENEPTEEIILSFLEVCFARCMRAKFLEVEKQRLNNLQEDF